MLRSYSQCLSPLLTGHIAGLVWMPYLFAVIAELSLAAFPLTGQLGATGTAVGNNSVTEEDTDTRRISKARKLF